MHLDEFRVCLRYLGPAQHLSVRMAHVQTRFDQIFHLSWTFVPNSKEKYQHGGEGARTQMRLRRCGWTSALSKGFSKSGVGASPHLSFERRALHVAKSPKAPRFWASVSVAPCLGTVVLRNYAAMGQGGTPI